MTAHNFLTTHHVLPPNDGTAKFISSYRMTAHHIKFIAIITYTTEFNQTGNLDSRIGHIMIKDTETGQKQIITLTQSNK